jgi:membrane protein DedA with SNARE-associated domain
VGAAVLASAGNLAWQAAFIGCFLGIWVGDALLYLFARGFGRPLLQRSWAHRFFDSSAVARSERWFSERGAWLLLTSRFLPGTRLPTYLAAGFLRLPFGPFLAVTGTAAALWTAGIFVLAKTLGPDLLRWLQCWNSGGLAAIGVVVALVLIFRASARVLAARGRSRGSTLELPGGRIGAHEFAWRPDGQNDLTSALSSSRLRAALGRWTRWEFWPAWLFYVPVAIHYLRLALRYRGLTVPTAANPGIFSGGFVGESKIATLRELFATSPGFTAEAHLLAAGAGPDPFASFERARAASGLDYPLILKPDVGQRGVGVKRIRDLRQAAAYLEQTCAPLILQRYAPGPHEAGVFYYRFPDEPRGHIFAITEKVFPTLTGDGQRTLEELVWADERARFLAARYLDRFGDRRSEVPPAGEKVPLVEAGNHAQGCIFRDGWHLWSEDLEKRVDEISRRLDGFYIGRYDIRYSSEADFRAGKGFKIIELNGAASEATSIYDARNSLRTAYRTLFRQWELVFAIGAVNRGRGCRPTDPGLLWRKWRETVALARTYPLSD